METGDQVPEDPQFMADLTPDSLDAMDDGDLRKACQMVLKRDIGPITDSTRDLYKLAVKRALIGHPIVFDKDNNESNTEVPSDSDYEEIKSKEITQESLPSLSPPTPPRISRNSPLVTKQPFDPSPFTSIKRSFPETAPSPFSPRPKRIEQRSNFLRNAFIVGIGAVLLALVLAFLLSD